MNAFLFAFRASRYVPRSLTRGLIWSGTMLQWARHAKPARRLEDNLHRVTGLEGDALRSLSRKGMASTARYYAETFELGRMSDKVVDARVRVADPYGARDRIAADGRAVLALSHSGNWDLVGAYACRHIARVITVAEILKPREVFDEFVALREKIGMTVLGHEGSTTFRELIRLGRSEDGITCLLADRDLSGSGVEVDMWGHGVKVAPGPAALSATTGNVLIPVFVHYERLHGRRRWAARSRWGVVLSFGPVTDPADAPSDDRVGHLTRAWVQFLATEIAEHPEDWHMLQRFGWTETTS
ncbi:phosphatidylinositol mannoside acyltransferase [Demequina mangrovi]|uniref:KDO2-lipid IV(A) lauroyltransferase n=1 Tax=Demequina mangrovi TaxID=1043493 RepID=A0A1H6U567_9MICO|nr:phosphatidylinositol mannoside acyltransferase [Demequina mangrovi]SEI87443.1 KDO2-lipid IV(A) lauroyltransferase [Demequina mangrovi]